MYKFKFDFFTMFFLQIFLLISLNFFGTINCVILTFDRQFPIYENEEFPLKIVTKNAKNLPLYTILIVECSKYDKVVDKAVINPGFLKGLPRILIGEYLSVLRYNISADFIRVVFTFKKLSNGANLRFIYLETDSVSARNELLYNPNKQSLYTKITMRISLHLNWVLELTQRTLDHREDGFIPGSVGVLICRATEGSPFSAASLSGTESLQKFGMEVNGPNEHLNEVQFKFMPQIKDHRKNVGCRAGKNVLYKKIAIFHHPTEIVIVPPIFDYVMNDSTLLCKAKDGYPSPKSNFIFVNGPKNAQNYFSIKNLGERLHIKKDAPVSSTWTFQCQVTNHIPNSLDGGVTKTFTFIIGVKPFPLILVLALVTSFLLLAVFVTLAICLFRSKTFSESKKKPLTTTAMNGKDHGIFSYKSKHYPRDNSQELLKKESGSTKDSKDSSLNSDYLKLRGNNPVDLV